MPRSATPTCPRIRHIAGAPRPPEGSYDADIVILALDRAEETCAAIDSACSQRDLTCHITVLDQASHPAALDRIARHVGERADVTLLASDRNLGVGGGRNHASAFGHGRMIAVLDNDAEFATHDMLARGLATLEADPTIGVLGCRIVVHATGEDDLSSWGYPLPLLPRAGECFDTATFVGAGHMIRRATWDAAGGYDESLFFCWEEYDFSLRAITAGWRVHYRGDLLVRHKICPERRVGWSDTRWSQHVRNRLYIGRKCGQSLAGLAPRIAGYAIKGLRNGRLGQTLSAIQAALAMPIVSPIHLPGSARVYLHATDGAIRGTWGNRLRNEVLAAIPGERRPRITRAASVLGTARAAQLGS
jgi:GT2 family glycosyltransferase